MILEDDLYSPDTRFDEPSEADTTERSSRRFALLSRALRAIGAAILLSSAAVFLLQGWRSGDDLVRYAALLGLSAALTATGLVCGVAIRESKAARTLLAVALALIPVHSAVLGALLYSRFDWDGSYGGTAPAFGVWIAPSATAALTAAGAALVALVPMIYIAARALVPPHAARLTALTVAINLPLLVPVRAPGFTALVIAAGTALLLSLELRWVAREPSLRTFEGLVVRLLLATPLLLALGRAHLHEPRPALLHGVALIALGVAVFVGARRFHDRPSIAEVLDLLALAPGVLGWLLLLSALPIESNMLWLTLPPAKALLTASVWSAGGGCNYRRLASVIAGLGVVGHLLNEPGVAAALLALAVGIAVLGYGYYVRQKLVFASGAVAALCGLGYQLHFAVELFAWSRWGSLAVLGLATVLTAALLERHQERTLAWIAALGRRIGSWRV